MIWIQFFFRAINSLKRNFMATLMMFGFPIVFFFVFGVLMNSAGQAPSLQIAVADQLVTSTVVEKLSNMNGIEVELIDESRLAEKFYSGDFAAAIDGTPTQLKAQVSQSSVASVAIALRAAQADQVDIDRDQIGSVGIELVEVKSGFVQYAMPGLFALALLQLMIYATAVPILDERAKGTWRLFATLPITNFSIFLGESAARIILAAAQILILILLLIFVLDFQPVNGWLVTIPVFTLAAFMCIALGFAIGGALPDERWGIHLLTFLNLYMLFFGNIFSPTTANESTRIFALINPLTYVSDAVRTVVSGIPGTFPLSVSIVAMIAWTVLAVLASTFLFKFETVTAE